MHRTTPSGAERLPEPYSPHDQASSPSFPFLPLIVHVQRSSWRRAHIARLHDASALWTGLVNEVEWRLGDPAEACETACRRDVANPRFAGLGAKCQADVLGQRVRRAEKRGEGVVRAADGIEVL